MAESIKVFMLLKTISCFMLSIKPEQTTVAAWQYNLTCSMMLRNDFIDYYIGMEMDLNSDNNWI